MKTRFAASVVLLTLLCACSGSRAVPSIQAVRVASGLAAPLYATAPPGDLARVFVLEQYTGRIRILERGVLLARPFLTVPNLSGGDEQGLLGLAFHPQYASNGYFYVDYTDAAGTSVVQRFRVSSDPDSADPASAFTVLTEPQPQSNHNGGWVGFGPDGYLYIGFGDGGNGGDVGPGHDPAVGNGQSDTTRLGKILRLDVDGGSPYAIPPSNPFAGAPSPKNEVWAKGVRNPWRCSFDRGTGDLYIGDVGQDLWEEFDHQPAGVGGRNYGWHKFEGFAIYSCPGPCDSSGLTRPVYSYDHGGGRCAITGGYVYRGQAMPALAGTYFYGDYCSGQVWTTTVTGNTATTPVERTAELTGGGFTFGGLTSFGEDGAGEIYLCVRGAASGATGELFKIVPASPASAGPAPARSALLSLGPVSPNPGRASFSLRLSAARTAPARVGVYDAAGRLVRALLDGLLPGGVSVLPWDGRDAGGTRVPGGVYVVRAEALGEVRTRKVAVLD